MVFREQFTFDLLSPATKFEQRWSYSGWLLQRNSRPRRPCSVEDVSDEKKVMGLVGFGKGKRPMTELTKYVGFGGSPFPSRLLQGTWCRRQQRHDFSNVFSTDTSRILPALLLVAMRLLGRQQ